MKIAYLLLVHKNPEQINVLIEQLLTDFEADIYIHVNKLNDNIKEGLKKDKRIYILENNIEVYWGNESINRALMLLLKTAQESKFDYQYYSFKTGQDLMIRKGIKQYLEQNQGKIFLNPIHIKPSHIYYGHYSIRWPNKAKRLYEKKFNVIRIYRKLLLVLTYIKNNLFPKKTLPDNMELYWGRFWGFIPKDVVIYLLDFYDRNIDFVKSFHKALVPEEMFLHTVIMNSYFAKRIMFDDLCMLVGHKNNHPTVVTTEDIPNLEKSNSFFARKFDILSNKDVIDYYYNKIKNL